MAWWLLTTPSAVTPPAPNSPVPKPPAVAASSQDTNPVQLRSEVLRTALAAGVGVGAAITLMLAFRRQRHQELTTLITSHYAERTAEHTEHDAIERRVTDLYTKAVEQLGSEKAAVRLGGLYALERLAQDNPAHRQTIVNVICAYLRMPYTVPNTDAHTAQPPGPWQIKPVPSTGGEGERQVRLTAQRILAEHLKDERTAEERDAGQPTGPRFWDDMRIDLSGAILISFDINRCRVSEASFSKATFTGNASFDKATFTGAAWFDEVTFTGTTWFHRATFTGETWFNKAIFTKNARFNEATFTKDIWCDATFTGEAGFRRATFTGTAWFDEATFTGEAGFDKATFSGEARFNKATFSEDAEFRDATFTGNARFGEVTFSKGAYFQGKDAQVFQPDGHHSWPDGWVVVVRPDGTGFLQRQETVASSANLAGSDVDPKN
ncbi:pentapeptide repeat-containing protein [Streptosporangium roseum]|nr:pentapeptide repeat-containing protein [Streptosporangium roseum]